MKTRFAFGFFRRIRFSCSCQIFEFLTGLTFGSANTTRWRLAPQVVSFMQVTNFKCGGYSIGFSCSVLAMDPFTFISFLKQWASIHYSILSEPQIPKVPLFHQPNLQNTTNLDSTTSLVSRDKSISVIFKTKSSSGNLSIGATLCIEEAERKLGTRLDNRFKFTLV